MLSRSNGSLAPRRAIEHSYHYLAQNAYRAATRSIFAAQMKSFSDKPPIECVL
jgi:hypothetical protein